jgi:hypothetical protein
MIAALSLATDLGICVPLEYGLHSTLFAMRLADRLGVDPETASQTYYACLLFYVGFTANTDIAAEIFGGDDSLTRYADLPVFGEEEQPIEPIHRRGIVESEPGLYFVGLFFLYAMSSGFLPGVGRDAEHIVKDIATRTR